MSVQSFAPIVEVITLAGDSVATIVGSSAPFRVYGIVVSTTGGTASTFTFQTVTDSSEMFVMRLAANVTVIMNVPFIADKGLKVLNGGSAVAKVTVLRGHSGT